MCTYWTTEAQSLKLEFKPRSAFRVLDLSTLLFQTSTAARRTTQHMAGTQKMLSSSHTSGSWTAASEWWRWDSKPAGRKPGSAHSRQHGSTHLQPHPVPASSTQWWTEERGRPALQAEVFSLPVGVLPRFSETPKKLERLHASKVPPPNPVLTSQTVPRLVREVLLAYFVSQVWRRCERGEEWWKLGAETSAHQYAENSQDARRSAGKPPTVGLVNAIPLQQILERLVSLTKAPVI